MQFVFSNISWLEYLTFITVSALLYYVFVLFTFYRHDLLQITKMPAPGNASNSTDASLNQSYSLSNGKDPGLKTAETNQSQIIQSFTDEVAAYLEEAGKNNVAKADLLFSLGGIANKYPSLTQSEFKESLDQFIKLQTETYCAMFLSEEDLNNVWRDS